MENITRNLQAIKNPLTHSFCFSLLTSINRIREVRRVGNNSLDSTALAG